MAPQNPVPRFALRSVRDRRHPDGAWWPENRMLSEQLGQLFGSWPPEAGRIVRVLYSPPDWDDRPRSVGVPGRRVKTGSFPRDDTHRLTLSLRGGERRSLVVIPSDTPAEEAHQLLQDVVRLPDGSAPGSEERAGEEGTYVRL